MTKEHAMRWTKEGRSTHSRKFLNIVVHSSLSPELLIDEFNKLSITTGCRRFNLFIIGDESAKSLENVREIVLSNHIYTISVYVLSEEQLKAFSREICIGETVFLSPMHTGYLKEICGD
ncbi:MAG: hypothetical protein QXZ32_04830 [Desulfurococcaceae archaeon]